MRLLNQLGQTLEGVVIAFEAIRANRVRAGLTIGGVAIGVFVVVAMSAAVHGITRSFQQDVDALGATTFQVMRRESIGPRACDGTDETCPDRRNPSITPEEAQALRRLPSIRSVAEVWGDRKSFRYRSNELSGVGYDAVSAEWMETDAGDIDPGRNFSAQENAAAARVVIVNDTLKARLFGESDPIGKVVTIAGQPFTVIGVYHTKGGFLKQMSGRGPNDPRAVLPIETARRHLDLWRRGVMLRVKPSDGVSASDAMDDVTAALRARRGLRPSQPNNFGLITSDRLTETFDKLFGTIFVVGLALSGVGLLVGGVGVVAIMMISVTERTREIGVRKALGATRATILFQFLVEAATLTSIGAGLGLLLGAGAAFLIRNSTVDPGRRAGHGGGLGAHRERPHGGVVRHDPGAQGVATRPGGGAPVRVIPGRPGAGRAARRRLHWPPCPTPPPPSRRSTCSRSARTATTSNCCAAARCSTPSTVGAAWAFSTSPAARPARAGRQNCARRRRPRPRACSASSCARTSASRTPASRTRARPARGSCRCSGA
jgi:putative ABC transport system permease protein